MHHFLQPEKSISVDFLERMVAHGDMKIGELNLKLTASDKVQGC